MSAVLSANCKLSPARVRFDIVAKRDGYTFGFHREVEAQSYSEAHKTTRERLIRDGLSIVKIRRAA